MEIGAAANKLRNGLDKLIDTREKVEAMTVELEDAKAQLAIFQKQCEEYLVVIVQQKRDAEEQEKSVASRSEKIAVEEARCQVMAENAQKDLDEAVPALEEAMRALESLNKKDLGEIKAYTNPPELVETVLQAVMILRQSDPTWSEAKRQLGDTTFIKQLVEFDRDNMTDKGMYVCEFMYVHVCMRKQIQWSLSTRDKLGTGPLSLIQWSLSTRDKLGKVLCP